MLQSYCQLVSKHATLTHDITHKLFTLQGENPSCQASSYPFVSASKVVQPISVLVGTTSSYRRGFDDGEKRPWKQTVLNKEVRIDTVRASVISELESVSSPKEEQRMTLKAFLHGKDVFALLLGGFDKSLS